jgi:hypothetical protein
MDSLYMKTCLFEIMIDKVSGKFMKSIFYLTISSNLHMFTQNFESYFWYEICFYLKQCYKGEMYAVFLLILNEIILTNIQLTYIILYYTIFIWYHSNQGKCWIYVKKNQYIIGEWLIQFFGMIYVLWVYGEGHSILGNWSLWGKRLWFYMQSNFIWNYLGKES